MSRLLDSLGAVPENPHRAAVRYGEAQGLLGPTSASDLHMGISSVSEREPATWDQEGSSCMAHSWVSLIYIELPDLGLMSPDGLYRDARAFARRMGPKGQLPPLTDCGLSTSEVRDALEHVGVRRCGSIVPGKRTDVVLASINREPRLDELQTDAECLLAGEYVIDTSDMTRALALVQKALDAEIGVHVMTFVDSAFEDWGDQWSPGKAPLADCNLVDPKGGFHGLTLTELCVTSAGAILSGGNSWGDGWGAPAIGGLGRNQGGHWRAEPDWLRKSGAVLTVGKVARQ